MTSAASTGSTPGPLPSPSPDARIYHHRTRVGLADVTPSGRARLDAVARWLQDAAWRDVVDSALEDDGIWIVRRLVVHVVRAPRFDEALDAATFCSGAARMWAERRTSIRGESGGHVETAALWVHLSPDGARPRPLPDGFDAVYGAAAAGRRVKARLHHPADPPPGADVVEWSFRQADLDMAAHVNNAAYWEVLEQDLAGAELPPGWSGEIEHRGPAAAGPATVHRADGLRWIVSEGAVVASLRSAIG